MNRRALLAALSAMSVGPAAGCLSTPNSPNVDARNTDAPTATKQTESAGLSATVTRVSYDGTAGENEERVTLSGDCTAQRATLKGWFSTSSCRTVVIRALHYDESARDAELVLYPRWDEAEPPERTDCAGASYQYHVELSAREQLPTEVRVVYARPDERPSTAFTVQIRGCS